MRRKEIVHRFRCSCVWRDHEQVEIASRGVIAASGAPENVRRQRVESLRQDLPQLRENLRGSLSLGSKERKDAIANQLVALVEPVEVLRRRRLHEHDTQGYEFPQHALSHRFARTCLAGDLSSGHGVPRIGETAKHAYAYPRREDAVEGRKEHVRPWR
ncbi:MAG TPA: hypothetical protein VGR37_09105 [Longimicrobiaceae bacterium]|nr:hypothetical protein [Longimicrobiaceae bacterium]